MNKDAKLPEIDRSQLRYGNAAHAITIASCIISLVAPVLILLLPEGNILNPNLTFSAIFDGKLPVEIWGSAGYQFRPGGFWEMFFENIFAPDGFAMFGVALGCSGTLWAMIPALFAFARKREWFFMGICIFIMVLIALAMSGLIDMAG